VANPINVVIDLAHHNEKVDFAKIATDGIVGVIYKATQGLTYVDKMLRGPAGSSARGWPTVAHITLASPGVGRTMPTFF
jgi:GH25 family lysozyme M1 (1,4-beta-N-acetylmuramidase)